MALNFAGAATLSAAGSAIATIDAGGNFSITNRPLVVVHQSAAGTAIGSDLIFNAVTYNVGNHYNTTNGRFTAPVAGVYHVMWRHLAENAAAAGEYVFGLYLNGNSYAPSYTTKQQANTWNSNSFRTHIYMNAGDYCTLRYVSGFGATYIDGAYTQYSIHLVL